MDYIEYVIKAREGDRISIEYLINAFQGVAVGYAYTMLYDFHKAEDAAQEAFILLLRNIHNLKEPSAFITWLRRLVFTCCNRILRRHECEITISDIEERHDEENDTEHNVELNEKFEIVKSALSQLSKGQQEVFFLFYTEGNSYTEIAQKLQINETTVANRLCSGKRKLKNILLTTMKEYLGGYALNKEVFMRKVLEKIPLIYVNNPSENFVFCGCMQSLMQYLNENDAFDYTFFSGVTGDSFSQLYYRTPVFGAVDSLSHDFGGECIKFAFEACGYEYRQITTDKLKDNLNVWINKITDSINIGLPVISKGFGTSPHYSLICGYEDDGKILIGITQSENGEKNEYGYVKFTNGLESCSELIFIGNKTITPTISDSVRKAVLRIPRLASMPATGMLSFGRQAFDDWADALLLDELLGTEEKRRQNQWSEFCLLVVLATNAGHPQTSFNGYVKQFLERASYYLPEFKDSIAKAMTCYDNMCIIVGELFDMPDFVSNGDSVYRKKRSDLIREAGYLYEKASAYFSEYDCTI